MLLHTRYLAGRPVDTIQCVAQIRRRHRCTRPVLSPSAPPGTWTLVPATTGRRQLTLPEGLMAVYGLTHLTYAEQLRWRHQRCPHHAAAPGAADLALAEWEPFDPLLHHQHVHTRLPTTIRNHRRRQA
ncbi:MULTISPECIES: hypothetical protein [unclassified Streptomyces]|uniref:hypothetical protein n=1 Tax=unclassified Streptomyces TaxID=2593676 RepID=UPI00299FDCFF|nr:MULTISPECIES: hypothetical protein [unclassified Streptomyces]MDX3772175.1 hypothetical protein [Streptomyces sp. AK08-01B]MDX3821722.1 hypothetical protein [Streptomyces sp. AK08-01A]